MEGHNEVFVRLRPVSSVRPPSLPLVLFPLSHRCSQCHPTKAPPDKTVFCVHREWKAAEVWGDTTRTEWLAWIVQSCRLPGMFALTLIWINCEICGGSKIKAGELKPTTVMIVHHHDWTRNEQSRGGKGGGDYYVRRLWKEHTVPSSFTCESINLVKEDDGGSDGPRLPKHLRAASATIEKRKTGQMFNRTCESLPTRSAHKHTEEIQHSLMPWITSQVILSLRKQPKISRAWTEEIKRPGNQLSLHNFLLTQLIYIRKYICKW